MKILVTGADGMLGSNLVRLLIERNHEVSVFLYPSSKSKTLEGLKINKYFGDVIDPDSLDEPFKNTDVVIHAAASTSIWPARSEIVRKVNIKGTQNVIDKVLEHGIGKLIYIGSASSVNAKESSNNKYAFPGAKYRLDYIDSKYHALNLVMEAVKTRRLPAIAILPTFMIGPYDSLPGSGKMILALATGKLKFYSGGGRNFIHVSDVTTAIANSLELSVTGKYFIAGNENLSYKDFFKKVATVTGKPAPRFKIPDLIIKSVGLFGSGIAAIIKKPPLLSYPMARISCENQFVSSEDAINELKMPQSPVETAIADCYKWFKTNSYC